MENCKTIILQSFFNEGGMQDYAEIFINGYGKKTKNIILFKKNYWRISIVTLLNLNRKQLKETLQIVKDFEIVHITDNSIFDRKIVSFLLKETDCRIVYTMHDPIPHQSKGILNHFISKILYHNNVRLLEIRNNNFFIHIHSHKLIPEKFKNQKNILIQPHPLSIVNEDVEDFFKISSNSSKTISFVGRVEYYKGIDLFLKSISELDRLNINFNVIIAGIGRENIVLPKTNNISIKRLDKFLTNDELDSIIKYSDAIVLPYREATASGIITRAIPLKTPIICTNVGSLSEYVEDGKTGIVISNSKFLTESIFNFIIEPNKFSFNAEIDDHPFSSQKICKNITTFVLTFPKN